MSEIPKLEKPSVTAHFDPDKRLIFVAYIGVLDTQPTLDYYHWMQEEMFPHLQTVRGAIFDFREVTKFQPRNALTVLHASRNLHQQIDLRHMPVALIIKDIYQEHMVRIAANMTPQTNNKHVVHSMDEALTYIKQWNENR